MLHRPPCTSTNGGFAFATRSKKKIKEETHLLPQSCFEIGMIYREMGKPTESKRWLKRARDDHSDYLTESMIQYRVQWALDLLKKQ